MAIIGLVGFAGSGKGTVGDILVDTYNYKKLAFADTVKDATSVIFSWPRHLLEGDTDESRKFRESPDEFWSEKFGYDFTPRYALQLMGTEAGRQVFSQDLWIFSLEKRMRGHNNVVISDVRFPNEIEFIRQAGGFIIRVVRGPEPEWYDTAHNHNKHAKYEMHKKYPDIHVSEWAWIGTKFDYVIDNNGTKEELEASTKHMLDIFTGPVTMTA